MGLGDLSFAICQFSFVRGCAWPSPAAETVTSPAGGRGGRVRLAVVCLSVMLLGLCGCSSKAVVEAVEDETASAITTETSRGPVSLQVRFSPESPSLSDEVTLSITIRRDEQYSVLPPEMKDLFEDFLISDFDTRLPRTEDGKIVVEHVYTLEPLTPGEVTLEAIPYRFRAGKDSEPVVVETEPLIVQVRTMLDLNNPSLTDLADPQDPLMLAPDPYRHAYWIAGGVLLAGLLIFAWLKRKKKPVPVGPVLTPAQIARRDLDALRASGLAETDHKEFYVELTGIVRRYVEGTTNIRAPEQTTGEFLREIEQRRLFSTREQEKFRYFLEAADLVKYAAQTPGEEEIGASWRTAEAFVVERVVDGTQPAVVVAAEDVVS